MRVLALDLSLSTGYAVFDKQDDAFTLVTQGRLSNDRTIHSYGDYPFCYVLAAQALADLVEAMLFEHRPDVIVIEETNGSRSRYTQKILEFIHYAVLTRLSHVDVVYVNTGDWRRTLGIVMGKADKKQNAKLAAAKRKARQAGKTLDKKGLGIRGRINKKHLALRYVNDKYPHLNLKVKDDDVADAICIGLSYLQGVAHCDGRK